MELALESQNTEPFPNEEFGYELIKPAGLMNTNYKTLVKRNLDNEHSTSLFGIKQGVKIRQFQKSSSISTILKLSVFVAVLAMYL